LVKTRGDYKIIRIDQTETFLSIYKNKDQHQIECTSCSNVVGTAKLIEYNYITHFMKPEARRLFLDPFLEIIESTITSERTFYNYKKRHIPVISN
jgi:hypothetical protein